MSGILKRLSFLINKFKTEPFKKCFSFIVPTWGAPTKKFGLELLEDNGLAGGIKDRFCAVRGTFPFLSTFNWGLWNISDWSNKKQIYIIISVEL